MIFLRLGGCPLRCTYCDEPQALVEQSQAVITPLESDPYLLPNPFSPTSIAALLDKLHYPSPLLSITGGEPLHQPVFLKALLPSLKNKGYTLYLETAGTRPEKLSQCLPYLDFISLDWKSPSHLSTPLPLSAQQETLNILHRSACAFQLKIVLTPDLTQAELETSFQAIANITSSLSLILQPVTPFGKVKENCSPHFLRNAYLLAARSFSVVRLIPQMHKLLNLP